MPGLEVRVRDVVRMRVGEGEGEGEGKMRWPLPGWG